MYTLKSNHYTLSIPRSEVQNKDKYMKFYPSFFEALSSPTISDSDFKLAIQLMYEMYFDGLEIDSNELPDSLYAPFRMIGESLKSSKARSTANKINGTKGGAKTKENSEKAKLFDAEHLPGNLDPEATMQNMLEGGPVPLTEEKPKEKKQNFKKPTKEEVQTFINENGLEVNASKFIDFYESNGWKVGKNPMKNWKAAVRNWSRRDQENKPEIKNQTVKKVYEFESCPGCNHKTLIWEEQKQKFKCDTCKAWFKWEEVK